MNVWWLLPILHFVFLTTSFVSGYIIIVAKNLTDPFLPFISDGGAFLPQSAIFGQLLNIASALLVLVVLAKFKQIKSFLMYANSRAVWNYLNFISMLLGLITAMGMSLIANFQEYSLPVTHLIGALFTIIGGFIYILINLAFYIKFRTRLNSPCLMIFRIVLAAIHGIFLIVHIVSLTTMIFVRKHDETMTIMTEDVVQIERYDSNSPFYCRHLLQTISEWILVYAMEIHFLTYVADYKLYSTSMFKTEYVADDSCFDITLTEDAFDGYHQQ
uniref:DNA damage-regulated autophagy modulator protein 2 n=1 Tax=Rhabditophanes sp. KR3021 TaxID=114890 RepID=A0AC35TJ90_9BILA